MKHLSCFLRISAILLVVVGISPCPGSFGQASGPLDEIALGLALRSSILEVCPKIEGTPANLVATQTFNALLSTPVAASGAALPYEISLIRTDVVNAFSTAGGKVYVTSGLVPLLGQDAGPWAAVVGHEIAHTSRSHQYKAYLRAYQLQSTLAELREQAAHGNRFAMWALLGVGIGGGMLNQKLSRDEEHEADLVALMMMAQAGYHPDFMLTLQRRFIHVLGDQSKFAAFFSDHPRWETREQRTIKTHEQALTIFESRWEDPASSPGGTPPPVVTLGQLSTGMDEKSRCAIIKVSLNVRNAKDLPLAVGILITKNKKPVPAALPDYRMANGALVMTQPVTPTSWNQSFQLSLPIPTAALGTRDRKLDATAVVVSNNELLYSTPAAKVTFPK